MYAIVKTGGKQYRVQKGDIIKVEKITPEKANQKTYKFKEILLLNDGKKVHVGAPFVKDAQVEAKILADGRDSKVIVYKYKSKKDYRRKQGHRQPFTQLEITKVDLKAAGEEKAAAKEDVTEKKAPVKKEAVKKEAAPKKEAVKKEAAPKKETAKKEAAPKKEPVKKEAAPKKETAAKKVAEKKSEE